MPWEKGAPSPGLVDFLAAHPELARGTVCVPGCGTGHDVRAWARAGFQAFGCDIAPSAIRLATRQTRSVGVRPPRAQRCPQVVGARTVLTRWADRSLLRPGTGALRPAFKWQISSSPPPVLFDWVFEHTLFCAIQPRERDDYVRALLRWLKPDGQYLAVNYLIPDRDGPPFGTTRDELWQRFSPHFELLQEWVPRSYPNRTGLELMLWWRRKAEIRKPGVRRHVSEERNDAESRATGSESVPAQPGNSAGAASRGPDHTRHSSAH